MDTPTSLAIVGATEAQLEKLIPFIDACSEAQISHLTLPSTLEETSQLASLLASQGITTNNNADSLKDNLDSIDSVIVFDDTASDYIQAGKNVHQVSTGHVIYDDALSISQENNAIITSSPMPLAYPAIADMRDKVVRGDFTPARYEASAVCGGPEFSKDFATTTAQYKDPKYSPLQNDAPYSLANAIAIMGPIKQVRCDAWLAEPSRVWAQGGEEKSFTITTPEQFNITMQFANGNIGSLAVGYAFSPPMRGEQKEVWGTIKLMGGKTPYTIVPNERNLAEHTTIVRDHGRAADDPERILTPSPFYAEKSSSVPPMLADIQCFLQYVTGNRSREEYKATRLITINMLEARETIIRAATQSFENGGMPQGSEVLNSAELFNTSTMLSKQVER